MPALMPTDTYGTITWLGLMGPRRELAPEAETIDAMTLGFEGQVGSPYAGRNRPSCTRVKSQHPKGTEIANVRQLSIVAQEDLDAIAAELGLDSFDPAWAGASIVLSGIPDFTHVPPSSRLQAENSTTLIIDMENRPCHQIGMAIEKDKPGQGKGFKTAATGRRGVTAWVERPGELRVGDVMRLHIPDQPVWAGLEAARAAKG